MLENIDIYIIYKAPGHRNLTTARGAGRSLLPTTLSLSECFVGSGVTAGWCKLVVGSAAV